MHPLHRPPTLPVTSQPLDATIYKQPIDITPSPNSWADSAAMLQQARPRTLEAPQPVSDSHPFCPRVGASCRVGDPCLCQASCGANSKGPGLVVKNLPANAGDIRDVCLISGSGRSPGVGNGYPLQYCLENPMNREAWQATVHIAAESDMTEAN